MKRTTKKTRKPAAAKRRETLPPPEIPPRYLYGLLYRPAGYAQVPGGWRRVSGPTDRFRHGIIGYDRPLTDDEVRSFEMVRLHDSPQAALAYLLKRSNTTREELLEGIAEGSGNERRSWGATLLGHLADRVGSAQGLYDPMGQYSAEDLLAVLGARANPRRGGRRNPVDFGELHLAWSPDARRWRAVATERGREVWSEMLGADPVSGIRLGPATEPAIVSMVARQEMRARGLDASLYFTVLDGVHVPRRAPVPAPARMPSLAAAPVRAPAPASLRSRQRVRVLTGRLRPVHQRVLRANPRRRRKA